MRVWDAPYSAICRDKQAVVLLRAGISGLSTLCLKRCRCGELLLDARLSSQRLLGLLGLRGTAGRGRDRSLAEAAGGERKTYHERKKYPLHLVTPLTGYFGHFYNELRFWQGRSAQFGDSGDS
jgi:hypothetical protein